MSGEGHAQGNNAAPPQQGQQQQAAPQVPAAPQSPIVGPKYYDPGCSHPADREDANFCEQRRAANAAEQSVFWTGEQAHWTKEQALWTERSLYVGAAGVALVVVSLVFTAWAAVAASVAAKAAQASVSVAAETAQRQLRAYMTFDTIIFEAVKLFDEAGGSSEGCSCKIVWKNGGATPATNVVAWANQTIEFDAIPDDFYMVDNPDLRVEKRRSVSVVGPGHTMNMAHILDSESIQKLGGRKHYIWAWIEYDDAFAPKSPRRRTEMCVSLTSRTEGDNISVGCVNHAHHNAMDEGCYREIQTNPRKPAIAG